MTTDNCSCSPRYNPDCAYMKGGYCTDPAVTRATTAAAQPVAWPETSAEELTKFIAIYDKHMAKYLATNLLHHFSLIPKTDLAKCATPSPLPAPGGDPISLQSIHDEVNALGGRPDQDNSYDQGIVDTVAKVLEIIERAQVSIPAPHPWREALEKIANIRPSLVPQELVDLFIEARATAKNALAAVPLPAPGEVAGGGAVREALTAIIQMDDDARAAHGKPHANLNGYGLVDLFDCVGHPFGAGEHKQQPYRSNQLEAALSDARAALSALPPAQADGVSKYCPHGNIQGACRYCSHSRPNRDTAAKDGGS